MSTKETVIRIGLYVIAMLFFTWCAVTCEAKAAEVIARTDNMELWKQVDVVDGRSIVCYWPKNINSGVAKKITTGISCVVISPQFIYIDRGNDQCTSNH